MKDKILTVVVPAYNAEKCLRKCIDSFIVSAIIDDIEVLVINDGSTDKTAEIAQAYVDKYPNSIKLINKENGGHGSGINIGIQNATGEYFKVVDADDWLNTAELVDYINLLKSDEIYGKNIDVIASDFMCIEDGTWKELREIDATNIIYRYGTTMVLDEIKPDKVIKMHSMTIRTEILKEHFREIDEHCFYVDAEYITYPVPYINTIYYDHRVLYMYRLDLYSQ